MNCLLSLLIAFMTLSPSFAFAEEAAPASYRGIGFFYYTIIGAILIYGINDAFGEKAMLIAAPIIVLVLYLMLPPVAS